MKHPAGVRSSPAGGRKCKIENKENVEMIYKVTLIIICLITPVQKVLFHYYNVKIGMIHTVIMHMSSMHAS